MGNVRVEVNYEGVGKLLKSNDMQRVLEERAKAAVDQLGDGYAYSSKVGKTRVNTSIIVTTWDAFDECKKNNRILKALK